MPSSPSKEARLQELVTRPFAHRGLHGRTIPENSRAAFRAAIQRGFGIELDVQAAKWGEPVVFHDDTLERLTESAGRVCGLVAAELEKIRLRGSEETIPSLSEVLELVGGRVPLLIELKAAGPAFHQLCYGVAASLGSYAGPVAVMSFNPRVGRWFSRHFPLALRGLVISEQGKAHLRGRMERFAGFWWSKPDFLAYDIRDLPSSFAAASGLRVLTWTVRTGPERERAARHADQIIFEESE